MNRAIIAFALAVKEASVLEIHWEQNPHIGRNGITQHQYQLVRESLRANTEAALKSLRDLLPEKGKAS